MGWGSGGYVCHVNVYAYLTGFPLLLAVTLGKRWNFFQVCSICTNFTNMGIKNVIFLHNDNT